MRTTITLPDPVFQNAKAAAQARGITLSAYIHEALISEMHRPSPPKDPNFRLPTFSGGFLGEGLPSDLIEQEDEEYIDRLLRPR
jgi:hypothetical protein